MPNVVSATTLADAAPAERRRRIRLEVGSVLGTDTTSELLSPAADAGLAVCKDVAGMDAGARGALSG
jgi:hypothetical protein